MASVAAQSGSLPTFHVSNAITTKKVVAIYTFMLAHLSHGACHPLPFPFIGVFLNIQTVYALHEVLIIVYSDSSTVCTASWFARNLAQHQ